MSRKRAVHRQWWQVRHQGRDKRSVEDQYLTPGETMEHVADVIEQSRQVLITHGNAPQASFIMLRSEIARSVAGMPIVPLVRRGHAGSHRLPDSTIARHAPPWTSSATAVRKPSSPVPYTSAPRSCGMAPISPQKDRRNASWTKSASVS